jgi:hypothetical protein
MRRCRRRAHGFRGALDAGASGRVRGSPRLSPTAVPFDGPIGSLPGPIWQSPIYLYRRARDGGHHRPLRRRQGDQLLAGSRSAPGCASSRGLYQPTHGGDIAVAKQVGSRLCAMLTATRSAQGAPPQPDGSSHQLAGCLLRWRYLLQGGCVDALPLFRDFDA